jgi:hypothetical protein
MDSNYKPPLEAPEAVAGDFDEPKASPPPPNALGPVKTAKDWFTFENRCMVCGVKFSRGEGFVLGQKDRHLQDHCEEGVLRKWGKFYEQVKAHPVGQVKQLLLRVAHPRFVAGAVFEKRGRKVWACVRCAPILWWIRKLKGEALRSELVGRGCSWSWH